MLNIVIVSRAKSHKMGSQVVTRQFFPGNVVRVLGICCHKSGKFCQRLKSPGQLFPHFSSYNLCYLWLCRCARYNQDLITCHYSCLNMFIPVNCWRAKRRPSVRRPGREDLHRRQWKYDHHFPQFGSSNLFQKIYPNILLH